MSKKYVNHIKFLINAISSCRKPDTWHSLQQCDVLLVRHDWDCGYNYQGKAYGHLIDTLGDMLIKRGLIVRSVARPFSKLVGVYANNSPISYNRSAFLIYLFGLFIRLSKGRETLSDWSKRSNIKLWGKILRNAKPCCVIGIMPDEALCQAGRLNNLMVYDLQHGVIADEHWYYGYKTRSDTNLEDLPTCFLCWDTASEMTLHKWTQNKGIAVKVVGNPWFSRFNNPQIEDMLVQEAMRLGQVFDNNKPTILFSLQWGMDKIYCEPGFNGVMVPTMENVILETKDKYNWLLRLHPVQLLGKENKSAISYLIATFGNMNGVDWEKCSQLPLPVILQQSDLHVTDTSTVTIEASWFGIRTGLLNQQIVNGGKYESYYINERDNGIAEVLPQNDDEIEKWIAEKLSEGRVKNDFYIKSKALSSFIKEIEITSKLDRKLQYNHPADSLF